MVTIETKDEYRRFHSFNDEPAIVSNGDRYWCKHGKFHRETDAACISHSGYKEYWLDGKQYPFDEWIKLTPISEEQKLQLILEK
jgi:hypothetical protein